MRWDLSFFICINFFMHLFIHGNTDGTRMAEERELVRPWAHRHQLWSGIGCVCLGENDDGSRGVWTPLSSTCSCCCRASSICCCCFSSSKAAMFLCSEWAPSSCSLRPLSWLIIINNWSSFSARDSGVPESGSRGQVSLKIAWAQIVG